MSPTLLYSAGTSNNSRQAVSFIQKIERDGSRDKIFGLIIGALVGDACGSSLDVDSYMPNEIQVVHSLKLGGGGRSSIGPGQVGHLSEMSINLMNAIVETNINTGAHAENVLDIDLIT